LLDFALKMDWSRMGKGNSHFAAVSAARTLLHGEISDNSRISAMGAGATRDATSADEIFVGGLRHRDRGSWRIVRKDERFEAHG
jgi:hypothetical protein